VECWRNASLYDSESLITEPKYSENDIWNMYLVEVKENDKQITDAWKEDADGILVFVSLHLLVSLFFSMTSKKRLVFSPQLLAPLSSNSTNNCPPTMVLRQ
jgi:uncharacterized protein DUF6535